MTIITEQLPSPRTYHSGRGGAGNYHTLTANPIPSPPPTASHLKSSSQTSYYRSGRGGAGNVHSSSERMLFSFDEELERDRLFHEHHAPVYSIGRGGAGNIVPADAISTRSHYSGGSAAASERSSMLGGWGGWGALMERVRTHGSSS